MLYSYLKNCDTKVTFLNFFLTIAYCSNYEKNNTIGIENFMTFFTIR